MFFLVFLISFVSATNIGYLVKNSADQNFIDVINELNLSYDIIDDSDMNSVNLSQYDILLIGNDNIRDADVNNYKSLIASSDYYDGWSDSMGFTASSRALNARIYDNESSISFGVSSEEFQVYTQAKDGGIGIPMYFLDGRKYSTTRIVTTRYNPGEFVISTKENPRRVFFGITESDFWTSDSRLLFKNSINYVLVGEDKDEDGFYSEFDCNDSNIDINPNATEIPYNGIDEDCNGLDLVDIDLDGYNSSVVGGQDCDDSDPSINPDSDDIYKNCKNDAPIILPINRATVDEGEIAEIIVHAVDPEGDNMTYYINDTRFTIINNSFSWQTESYDYGDYVFNVTVSDGYLNSSALAEVEVDNMNQAPVCNSSVYIEWQEDTNMSVNLSDYCYDPDIEHIGYIFVNTSSNTNIILESFEDEILNFSVVNNWFGEDWVGIYATDLKLYTYFELILNITPVNDAPVFHTNISDLTWNEDISIKPVFGLYDHFLDVDSDLSFNVTGNNNINITIDSNGDLLLVPIPDWFGNETVVFEASDEDDTIYSNPVLLTVLSMGEPPVFNNLNCSLIIEEDEDYECDVNVTDPEGGDIYFEIVEETNMQCDANENNMEIEYNGDEDYFGNASCVIRAHDNESYTDLLFEVEILPVNDAPEIVSYSPDINPRVLSNQDQAFAVNAYDVDGDHLGILWYLDNNFTVTGDNYLFNQPEGNYYVKAVVSDGNLSRTQEWNVFVGDIGDFSCSEVNGYNCSSNQICNGEFLGVYDCDTCCNIPCSEKPPEFNDVETCNGNISSMIEVKIENPDSGDDFKIGDTINVRLKIDNNADEDLDFDINAYLYDLSEDEEIEEYEDSVDIDGGEDEDIRFEFDISEDLEENNDYAIFARIIEEDEIYCNQDYVLIEIKRDKHDVVIDKIDYSERQGNSGEWLDFDVRVKNKGSKDEDVYINIENSKLGINQKTEIFELEEYDEGDDEAVKKLSVFIPKNVSYETYEFIIKAYFDDAEENVEEIIEILLGKEKQEETEIVSLGGNELNGKIVAGTSSKSSDMKNKLIILSISLGISIVLLIILIKLFA